MAAAKIRLALLVCSFWLLVSFLLLLKALELQQALRTGLATTGFAISAGLVLLLLRQKPLSR